MEVTISLPDRVFANLSSVAHKSRRRVDEIIAEKIAQEFSVDAEDLAQQIALCADTEILALAGLQMPAKQDRRLSNLLQKQGEWDLTAGEQKNCGN